MTTLRKSLAFVLIAWTTCGGATLFADPPAQHRQISGVYPHLAVYNQPADPTDRRNHGECGTGAIVPWAGSLWYLTYPQHKTTGSNDKLYQLDAQMNGAIRPESVGGTHASRMIHRESNQLILGPYFIDAEGSVRAADLTQLRGRMTAVMRHLTDPANKVYFFDMEGAIYEVDVRDLAVTRLFDKPVPGTHGKGGYTAQGRVVISNNGERGSPEGEDAGVLAQWDGETWEIVLRRQFLDVTGPAGIFGSPDDQSPLWAIGWDRRSVLLQLLDGGRWTTFRLPKASHAFDPRHGWYTEWPRIREIAPGRPMICVHGGMYDLPPGFSRGETGGLRPITTHLRYIPDFCYWNDRVVLGADDASMMSNPMCGQAQSNLWFGEVDDLRRFGPRSGWGGPWLGDRVAAGVPSDPFHIGGYEQRCLHLALGAPLEQPTKPVARCSDKWMIDRLPSTLRRTTRVTIRRGDFHDPTPGYEFTVDRDVIVYLAVDDRGESELDEEWEKTNLTLTWSGYTDTVFSKLFAQGRVTIPGHAIPHPSGNYAVPNLCFVKAESNSEDATSEPVITELTDGLAGQIDRSAFLEATAPATIESAGAGVTFTLQIDRQGDGVWGDYETIRLPADGYATHIFPSDFQAEWIRLVVDRDCQATAYFHYASPRRSEPLEAALFDALADAQSPDEYIGGVIRPAEHNRGLQWLLSTDDEKDAGEYVEVELDDAGSLVFKRPREDRSEEVESVAAVRADHVIDAASVVVRDRDGQVFRLPKGRAALDGPFGSGPLRGVREAVSERFLANFHGTFYEIPRIGNSASPDFEKMKPVASHAKRIADFCTWRGLLVLSGTRRNAAADGHYFAGPDGRGLWFGMIDDLWRLGKPVGQGGPWRRTKVAAGDPSDPYLMTGYDKKRMKLSHDAGEDVTFTVEIDFDHQGFRTYTTIVVPGGATVEHAFPAGFQAHWVRLQTDRDCLATAWFVYE